MKKVIIIGAGISGMTAGIYAANNGFDVTIYEKHSIPGGECTGWKRDGVFIDGCAHWIVGVNPKVQLYKLWEFIGAFNKDTKIFKTEYLNKFDIDGEIVTFYSDLKKLKNELLRIGPNDKKIINKFIKAVKAYQHVSIPIKKPMDLMNPFDYMVMGLKLLPMARAYYKYTHITIDEFASKCKSKILAETFRRTFDPSYNVHSLLYVMQALSQWDAGVVEGGSLKMALDIAKRFKDLGGKFVYNANVEKIVTKDNLATGIIVNNEFVEADYIIPTCDMHYTLFNLLDNKYTTEFYKKRFENIKEYALQQTVFCSYKLSGNNDNINTMVNIKIKPINIADSIIDSISIRCHKYDSSLNNGYSTITVMIPILDVSYNYFKNLNREDYEKAKIKIGNIILNEVINYYKINKDDIKLIDVATPLTYERYLNAYRGSYMSFITTNTNDKLMDTGLLDGLDNVFMAGQWVMPPGGLPIALFTGKHAAYRVSRAEKKKFKHEKD